MQVANIEKTRANCDIRSKPFYETVKRMFDITSSFVALVIFALPMFIIAWKIKSDSPGNAIYKQERLGLKGKPFVLYKFRSMRQDAEKNGAQWATDNDPRVTPFGKKLRATRLDELPQLWNILKGDMSVVGPRPERECFYYEFEKDVPDFWDRLQIMPGLTGWAQINGGYELTPAQKLVYDKEYMQKRSLLMDAKIILKTIKVVFTHDGAF